MIKIILVGPQGSGKTTLRRRFNKAVKEAREAGELPKGQRVIFKEHQKIIYKRKIILREK